MTPFASDLRRTFALLFSLLFCSQNGAHAGVFGGLFAEEDPIEVQIADPYIEMHSGPGQGYPVFHVEERGAWIAILIRKTDWFKIRTTSGKEGWVAREQMERTLTPSGERTEIRDGTLTEFASHRWEMAIMGGDFENADVMTLQGGFFFTPNLSVEASASKIYADFSDSAMFDISISIHPFPDRRFSPFFTIGTGLIDTDPKTTLVQELDQTDQLAHAGAGIRVYLTRRFVFRAQYKNYVIFQSTDDNQEIDEWKAGFSVFF